MNKRGDIPITVLVLGVFAVCAIVILSFFSNSSGSDNVFVNLYLIEKTKSLEVDYFFYESIGNDYFSKKIKEVKTDYNSECHSEINMSGNFIEGNYLCSGVFQRDKKRLMRVEYSFVD